MQRAENNFAEWCRSTRKALGLSQANFAAFADSSYGTIQKAESGGRLTLETMQGIVDAVQRKQIVQGDLPVPSPLVDNPAHPPKPGDATSKQEVTPLQRLESLEAQVRAMDAKLEKIIALLLNPPAQRPEQKRPIALPTKMKK